MKKPSARILFFVISAYLFSSQPAGAASTSDSSAIVRARAMLGDFTCPAYSGRWGNLAQENLTRAKKDIELFDRGISISKDPIDSLVANELSQFRGACAESVADAKKPKPDEGDVLAKAEQLMKQFHCPSSAGNHAHKLAFYKKEALSMIDDVRSHRNYWVSMGPVDERVDIALRNFREECDDAKKEVKKKVTKG